MKTRISVQGFDRAFDAGEDITPHLDLERARRPNLAARCVNVDFSAWMDEGLDARAAHPGITRQAPIKLWVGAAGMTGMAAPCRSTSTASSSLTASTGCEIGSTLR